MQNNYRYIEPATVLDKPVNAICIPNVNVQLFESCTAQYEVREITEIPPPLVMPPGSTAVTAVWGPAWVNGALALSGDDYTNWGTDDNYIYQEVAAKLGLTLLPL
jgi:hypothetical protein